MNNKQAADQHFDEAGSGFGDASSGEPARFNSSAWNIPGQPLLPGIFHTFGKEVMLEELEAFPGGKVL